MITEDGGSRKELYYCIEKEIQHERKEMVYARKKGSLDPR